MYEVMIGGNKKFVIEMSSRCELLDWNFILMCCHDLRNFYCCFLMHFMLHNFLLIILLDFFLLIYKLFGTKLKMRQKI